VTKPDGVALDQDRSASLLVRVWVEGGTDQFRARLTGVETSPGDSAASEVAVGLASSPGDVITLVESWLTSFLGSSASEGSDLF
jgi:hypothetical protein